mmetsp:Transcript_27986/g.45412  ORF Transcript_27986/g.45412 Transcript_27986/m.45412 type:complete len:96 (-) Transcript_27986:1161-1448(-)
MSSKSTRMIFTEQKHSDRLVQAGRDICIQIVKSNEEEYRKTKGGVFLPVTREPDSTGSQPLSSSQPIISSQPPPPPRTQVPSIISSEPATQIGQL